MVVRKALRRRARIFKKLLKRIVSVLFYCSGLAFVSERLCGLGKIKAILLAYHGVAAYPNPDQVSADMFEKQLIYLVRNYKVVSLACIITLIQEQNSSADNYVALTFDDGYSNLFTNVLPLLKHYKIPATVFVVPQLAGNEANWSADCPQSERRLLGFKEMRVMRQHGIEFGSHTLTHIDMLSASREEVTWEVKESKRILEHELGSAVEFFAYPWARFSDREVDIVKRSGYRAACAGGWGYYHSCEDLFSLKRILIEHDDALFDFKLKLRGAYNWLDWIHRWRVAWQESQARDLWCNSGGK